MDDPHQRPVWQVWHLTAGLPVQLDMALEVDVLGDGGPTQTVIDQIRKELRRRTGHNANPIELSQLIKSGVLRPDCL